MTLYAKTPENRPDYFQSQLDLGRAGLCMPPSKIDEILLEALDALAQTRRLHESTANPDTKRQTERILTSLHSTLTQLAPLGIHSASRLERVSAAPLEIH
jgi:hypothetical protein